jgi:hypothetical protein
VCDVNRTPSKKDKFRQRWSEKDEACFGTPINNILEQDFDFEKNLALFNKQVSYLFSDTYDHIFICSTGTSTQFSSFIFILI